MGCIPLSENQPKTPQVAPWRNTRHEIIFEADTKAGKTFDIVLIYTELTVPVSLEVSGDEFSFTTPGL